MMSRALATSSALLFASTPLLEIDVVFHADAHMPAQQPGLRHDRELHAADAEGAPEGAGRQHAARVHHGLGRRHEAVLHAQHQGPHRRAFERAVGDQVQRHVDVAGVEDLELGLDAGVADHPRHAAHVLRRVDDHVGARVHGVEVERADVGLDQRDVLDALFRRQQAGAGRVDLGVVLARNEAAARPGREVDDQLAVLLSDAVDDLAVELDLHRGLAALRIAHVDVHLAGAGLGRGQAFVGDLRRRDRQVRRLLGLHQVAGDGAGDQRLVVFTDAARRPRRCVSRSRSAAWWPAPRPWRPRPRACRCARAAWCSPSCP